METGVYEEINWLLGTEVEEERIVKYISPYFVFLRTSNLR